MDYLYDKVDLYDGLKHIIYGYGWTDHIATVQQEMADIEHHMLHFLENHDEQRIASPEFAGDANKAKPAMVVSATLGTSPTMIYFGQEVGEPAAENAGFGRPGRTSIFDYIGVPAHQRWMNNGKFDGGRSTPEERELRGFYKRLLNFVKDSNALMGNYREIHYFNKEHTENYDHRVFTFCRWSDSEKLIVISNFDVNNTYDLKVKIPGEIIEKWKLKKGKYTLKDQLYGREILLDCHGFIDGQGLGEFQVHLDPLESFIFKVEQ
jgi:glycosidase